MFRCPSSNIPWYPLLLLCITYATKAILLIVIGRITIRYYDLIPRSPTIIEYPMILYRSSSPTHPSSSSSHQDSNSGYYYNMTYMDLPSIGYMNIHTRRILSFVVCVALVSFVVFLLLLSTMYSCCRRPRIVRNNTYVEAIWWWLTIVSASAVLNSQTTDVAVYSAHGMIWITNYQHTRLIGYRFLTSSSQSLSFFLLSCQILLYVNAQ